MNIAVFGSGYVGLVAGVCLASKGHRVLCLDQSAEIVESINHGNPVIYEPGLNQLLQETLSSGQLKAALPELIHGTLTDVIFIAVGTPLKDRELDLSYILESCKVIAKYIQEKRCVVIVKSSVLPGTTDTLIRQALEQNSGLIAGRDFSLCMNPEFLRQGSAVDDFLRPSRIIFGCDDPLGLEKLQTIYADFDASKIICTSRTAEMIKFTSNCLLGTQLSVMNELARAASQIGGIDMVDVWQGVVSDERWSPKTSMGEVIQAGITGYLRPNMGFGGSCLPKDIAAMSAFVEHLCGESKMLKAVLEINENQPKCWVDSLQKKLGSMKGKKGLILGLTFKPGTNDLRGSQILKVIRELHQKGALLSVYDPLLTEDADSILEEMATWCHDWSHSEHLFDFIIAPSAIKQDILTSTRMIQYY